MKRQLENPQAGFITRTPKAPKPDLNGALTEAGRQVQDCVEINQSRRWR